MTEPTPGDDPIRQGGEEILTRDLSSGRIHRRYLGVSGKAYTIEADNLDAAGEYEVITADDLANAEPDALCLNCFPDVGEPEDAA